MGLFTGLVAPAKFGALNPMDDRYYYSSYANYGGQSLTGLTITEDTAMQASAVWACVRVISETLASVPLILYRNLPDDRRERAKGHYLYHVLHDQPNEYQTAFEFKEMLTAHCLLTGNAFARLVPGRRGAADQLLPMHPNRIYIEAVGGKVRYRYQEPDGTSSTYEDSEIFHLRGLSNNSGLYSYLGYNTDGRLGMSVLQYARESMGLSLATQEYAARLFGQGTQQSGVLKHKGTLSEPAQKRLKSQFEAKTSGAKNWHRPVILEEGMEWQSIQMTAEDAQMLSTRQFQIEDIARWFRVPLHMIQSETKSTTWGSGIESLSMGFVTFTMLPWAVRWQQALSRDLIADEQLYAEYLFDALLQADLKTRYEAYQMAAGGNAPWMSRNDILRRENMEPKDGLDAMLMPLNMTVVGQSDDTDPSVKEDRAIEAEITMRDQVSMTAELIRAGFEADASRAVVGLPEIPHTGRLPITLKDPEVVDATEKAKAKEPPNGKEPSADEKPPVVKPAKGALGNGHYALLLREAAGRVVRKEIARINMLAKRYASDPQEWEATVKSFYDDHVAYVEQTLGFPEWQACGYCEMQKERLLVGGMTYMEQTEAATIEHLMKLAIGEN